MINCYFDGAYTSVTSHPAYLHDYGQVLRVFDLDLPAVVEAHFSLEESGESILRMGTCEKGITHIPIPDSCLEETGSFYCYIFDRGDASGRTVYKIKIPVLKRADMPTETTEPSEQDVSYFEGVLASVNEAVSEVENAKDTILNGLTIGTVETLEPGEDAEASITSENEVLKLNLGIPKGDSGDGGGVGESTVGQSVRYDNTDYECGSNAERFNDYAGNLAIGAYSHAEGYQTVAIGTQGHAEGVQTKALGNYAHAEGGGCEAQGQASHAEGYGTKTTANNAHAEGANTEARGLIAHAEGVSTLAGGDASHAEGAVTHANGSYSHTEGTGTSASSSNQHAQGKYNVDDPYNKYADIVGIGTADNARANGETTDWTGVKWLKSDVRCGGNNMDDPSAISLVALANMIAALETRVAALEGGNG